MDGGGTSLSRPIRSTTVYTIACLAIGLFSLIHNTAKAYSTTNIGDRTVNSMTIHSDFAGTLASPDPDGVNFQHREKIEEGDRPSFPYAGSFILLGSGLIMIAGWFRRKHRNQSSFAVDAAKIDEQRNVNDPVPSASPPINPVHS